MNPVKDIMVEITRALRGVSNDWYFAGGSVASTHYNDVDIFFTTEQSFTNVLKAVQRNPDFKPQLQTDKAITYKYKNYWAHIQLIKVSFAPPLEMFKRFDLNKSKIAITPTLEVIKDPSWDDDLYVDTNNIKSNTFTRLAKYFNDKHSPLADDELIRLAIYCQKNNYPLEAAYEGTKKTDLAIAFHKLLTNYQLPETDRALSIIKHTYPELFI